MCSGNKMGSTFPYTIMGNTAVNHCGAQTPSFPNASVGNPEKGYAAWISEERGRVARELFNAVGESIADPGGLPALALELQAEALLRCNATYSGAVEAMRDLADAGHRLSMASSQESEYL